MKKQRSTAARVFRKLFKYSFLIGLIVSSAKLLAFIDETRRENRRRERRRSTAITLAACMFTAGSLVAAFFIGIRHLKRRRGGYVVDLFDRDEYDVVEPEEEDEFENIIHGELHKTDDTVAPQKLSGIHIPLDDEATEENFS